jgi:HEAT repeat protein
MTIAAWLPLVLAGVGWSQEKPEPDFRGRPLGFWVGRLRAPDPDSRREAVFALGEIGSAAAPAVPALLEALAHAEPVPAGPDPTLWPESLGGTWELHTDPRFLSAPGAKGEIAGALGRIGPAARAALPALLELMKEPNRALRFAAARAAGHMGDAAVPDLAAALRHRNAGFREAAVRALGEVGVAHAGSAGAILNALGDEDRRVRKMAVRFALQMGPEMAPALVAGLKEKARAGAAWALCLCGEEGRRIVREALEQGDKAVRRAACEALGDYHEVVEGTVPALVPMLKDEDARMRAAAARALGRADSDRMKAMSALVPLLLWDQSPDVRAAAARALGSVFNLADTELLLALEDPDAQVREAVVRTLCNLRVDRELPLLVGLLKDSDARVRRAAADRLANISLNATDRQLGLPVDVLVVALRDQDPEVRSHAAWLLSQERREPEITVPALMAALEDQDDLVRRSVASALGDLGPMARSAMPTLERLRREGRGAREEILIALARIDPAPARSVPLLLEAAASQHWQARDIINKAGERAIPILVSFLQGADDSLRAPACQALGAAGPKGEEALIGALSHPNAAVRLAAARGAPEPRGSRALTAALTRSLKDASRDVRCAAAERLSWADSDALFAPVLTAALEDEDRLVRGAAAAALTRFAPVPHRSRVREILEEKPFPRAPAGEPMACLRDLAQRWLGAELERRGEWQKAVEVYEAWEQGCIGGSAMAASCIFQPLGIARCRFQLGQTDRALETLEAVLPRDDVMIGGDRSGEAITLWMELMIQAGRIKEAERRARTATGWRDWYRKAFDDAKARSGR